MTCPDCGGAGFQLALCIECGPAGGTVRGGPHRCTTCHGTGTLPDETPQWRQLGSDIKAIRERFDRSQREFARQIGVSPFELSEAERGRVDPSPALSSAQAWERLQGTPESAKEQPSRG